MDPITYRVSHHKLSAAKRQPEVALCLSSVCKRSSFLFRFICFFFFTPPRRICPLTRSCSADLYQRITAIPRRPPTQKENQIKLYSAHLFSTENYLPEQLRQELGETPTSVGNPAASAAKSEHIRRPNRLSGSNFFPFFLRSSSSSSSRFIPHAASFFCYRSVGLKCFIRLADEAWRLKITKFNFCGGRRDHPAPAGDSACYFAQNGRHNKTGHLTRNK